MTKVLVSDFDGTMTRRDFFELVRERWPAEAGDDPWDRFLRGELTHFEALAEIFSMIRASEGELLELIDAMELDAGLADSVQALEKAGWEVVVASAGCGWYIERLLRKAGVKLRVWANEGDFDAERGLLMRLPEGTPFFKRETGVDKAGVMRDAISRAEVVAFAGDGLPDVGPALLAQPERRFARRWLAEALAERDERFRTFENWSQIASDLLRNE